MKTSSVDRRSILKGLGAVPLTRATLAGIPLTAILADATLSRAAAAQTEDVSITTAAGRPVSAALALPDGAATGPGLILIHEWWGLNDQIRSVAHDLARNGYVALAVDLYGRPAVSTPEEAKALMSAVKPEEATDTLTSWTTWLRQHTRVAKNKVGVIGWCFGGAWSLNTSIATPMDATVIYYGRVDRPAEDLRRLSGPVQGHFANLDTFITPAMADGFEATLKDIGHPHEIYRYDADHAFANPSGDRFDQDDAQLAWQRTMAFLQKTLAAT
ncbi:MAG: dienelactone hydrolase family protein [Rhodospirillaceae bacterium]